MDRISELPREILWHIQSFLSIKEVAQNSVLSQTWKQVSNIAPINLDFDESFFLVDLWQKFLIEDNWENYESEKKKDGEVQRALTKINQLFDVVDQILAPFGKHKFSMNRFILDIYLIELDWSSHFDKWIQQAIDSDVRELFIHIEPYQYDIRVMLETDDENKLYRLYTLPHSILLAKSVVALSIIGYCKIEFLPADFKINLSSLKKLVLYKVFLNDDALHKIIVGCHLVEDLTVHECEGFKTLHIPISLVNLTRLSVVGKIRWYVDGFHSKLELVCVEALNIVDIEFRGLVNLRRFEIGRSENLKSLILDYVKGDKWLECYYFPCLENFRLNNCPGLETLEIKCRSLKHLVINCCNNLKGIELDTPNLLRFQYLHSDNVTLSWNGIPPSHCSVFLILYSFRFLPRDNENDPDDQLRNWYLKQIEFLAKLNNRCRELYLSCFDSKGLIFPDELRQRLAPPLPNLKELTVRLQFCRRKHHSEELINSLHWMAPNSTKKYFFFNER